MSWFLNYLHRAINSTGTRTLSTALHDTESLSLISEGSPVFNQIASMPKRKCVFTDILQKSFRAFRPGRDKFEALCTVCKAGTYVSVSNGGARDLKSHLDTEKHKTAVRGESSGSLITQYFIKPGNEDAVNAAKAA
ncbi:hypothetical protein MHYP_G00027040 [Metynnis hypsauchen]